MPVKDVVLSHSWTLCRLSARLTFPPYHRRLFFKISWCMVRTNGYHIASWLKCWGSNNRSSSFHCLFDMQYTENWEFKNALSDQKPELASGTMMVTQLAIDIRCWAADEYQRWYTRKENSNLTHKMSTVMECVSVCSFNGMWVTPSLRTPHYLEKTKHEASRARSGVIPDEKL